MSKLALLPATEQARLVRSRDVSAAELLAACQEQMSEHNGTLNAVVTVNERAADEADAVDRALARGEDPGALAGLVVGIKDVTETAGIRTTYGSTLYADYVPEKDAEIVSRFRAAGAVILGKTNTPEFAAGGNTWNEVFGRTRNPWNTERSAGGSTGGGAAGLATGMLSLAQGTDLGGSLRIPASFCGVTGLRPSPGLIPTSPSWYLWDTLQVTGVMGRTAGDVGLALQALAGPSKEFPIAQPVAGREFAAAAARQWPGGEQGLAYCPDIAGIGIDPDVGRVCQEGSCAVACEEIQLDLSYGREAFLALRGLWFLAHLHDGLDRLDEYGVNVANNIRAGLEVTAPQLSDAERARRRMREELSALFETYAALLTPCMAVPPFPVDQNYPETIGGQPMKTYIDWVAPTFVLGLAGLPVASVPCGLDASGLPVGMQIVGPPQGEELVLSIAARLQAERPIGLPTL
ncbi:MAG: amidase family protein [Gemmatimonadota bacterium]